MANYYAAATDAQGRLTAPSVLSQIDARTKATMRADLPALAKELKIGGGSGIEEVSGTITLDATGPAVREFFTTGATTFKANGADTLLSSFTAVVWRRDGSGTWGYKTVSDWTATTVPDPGALTPVAPAAPTRDDAANTYTIPSQTGVTYDVDGQEAPPGTYPVGDVAKSLSVVARPLAGYRIAAGATSTWSLAFTKTPVATAYDGAVASFAPQWYLPLADAAEPLTNKGAAPNVITWHSNSAGYRINLAAEGFGGIGSKAVENVPGSRWWVNNPTTAPAAFTVAYAVDVPRVQSTWSTRIGGASMEFDNYGSSATDMWLVAKNPDGTTTASKVLPGGMPVGPHHFAATWDGATIRYYLDGVEILSIAGTTWGAGAGYGTLFAGAQASDPLTRGLRFAGLALDFSKAATAAQVKAMSDAVVRP